MLLQGFLIGFTLLIHGFGGRAHAAIDETISEHVGKTVVLPCPMNMDTCGALHSINWFKGDNRIAAVLLDDSNITSVSDGYKDRVIVEQSPFKLIIKDLQISDEDIYLCDTTFFIPVETCDNYNGYRVELNVLVPPTEVVIIDEKGDRIENGTLLGPLQEGHTLRSTCIVKNTRPQPTVGWFRSNKRLTTHSPTYDEKDGLYTATLELSLVLSRQDLANTIECLVESSAIDGVIRSQIEVDMQVRPTDIRLSGVEHHTVQGSNVVLTCMVFGARPAVNITWKNSSVPISVEENARTRIRTTAIEKEDGTFHTTSDLIFIASRFENDALFRCEADNIVLQQNREKPIYAFDTLEVMYPPVVKVSPNQITVNTSDTVLLNCEYVANPASLTSVKWYRNTDLANVNDTDRYEGGNSENVALVIKATDKEDIGNYTCQLSNAVGKGVSETQIELDVQYVPIVEVLMTPEGPVKENDESNVTLYCNIVDANPSILTKVRWYANSSLLKELPDCTETNEDLCHIDPSKLLLESIGRGFFYNYSCEGFNAAGWGPRSDDKELMVHYEPGPATLTHFPIIAVKKKSVTFSCSVEDPGYPESNRFVIDDEHKQYNACIKFTTLALNPASASAHNTNTSSLLRGRIFHARHIVSYRDRFRWFRGGRGHPLQDVVTKDWTVEPVGLDSRTNYSCFAYNEGGQGVPASVNLEVHAPPFFIKNLSPYTGILYSSRNASLMCRIECVPRCTISWYKDGIALEEDNDRYFVKEEYMGASPTTGDFDSVMSVLHFNMTAWPNKRFDINVDNANYSCVSSDNAVGPGIKSATYFSIEYPPEKTASTEIIHVLENNIPGRVLCNSSSNPAPSYEWRFNNKTLNLGNALIINNPMSRNDTGRYTCVAFNKHGSSVSDTFFDVQFKPKCEIERREIDDQDTLICTAFGNPEEADFSWSIKAENDSVELLGSGNINKDKSFYVLDEDYAIARTYRCVANNSVGTGTFCEIEVAEQLAWWQRWDKTTLIILVASILALLLAVIIICCIIICICRRRRRQDKYHTEVSISATQSVLSYQPTSPLPSSSASQPPLEIPKSPPRWPLRPGVMVHVKNDTKQNLAAHRLALNTSNSSGASTIPRSFHLSGTTRATVEPQPNFNCTSPDRSATTRIISPSLPPAQHNVSLGVRTNHSILRGGTQSLGRPPKPPKTVRVNPNNTILTDEIPRPIPPPLPPRNPRLLRNSINSTNLMTNLSATSANELLPKRKPTQQQGSLSDDDDSAIGIAETANGRQTNDVVRRSGFLERFSMLGNIFMRHKDDDRTRDSQRSQVGLLSSMFNVPKAFWKQKDDGNPFSAEHRLKGIRCSGSVTYKKTPTMQQRSAASDATPDVLSVTDADAETQTSNVRNATKPKTRTIATEIHDKSSSLGDPLTEPGEYENLPFHGLQTAPNKFTTTPTNFNNNTNVVRVAPRPKRLTTNHDTNQQLTHHQYHSNIQNHHQHHQLQPQQQLQQQQQQQQSYNTIQYNRNCNPSLNNTIKSTRSSAAILDSGSTIGIPAPPSSSSTASDHYHQQYPSHHQPGQQITYNLNNCFPKSYTEYYHQQQQQKFSTSNSQLLNSIEHDYPYTLVERGSSVTGTGNGNAVTINNNNSNNPFLAVSDFKKFDTTTTCGTGPSSGGSMHRTKRSKGHNSAATGGGNNSTALDGEKKFYSLKFPGNKKSHHHLNSIKPVATALTGTTSGGGPVIGSKCKRHHSFAGAGDGDGMPQPPTYATPMQSKMRFYEPPVYENLNDSIQIHECQVDTHHVPASQLLQQKERHPSSNPQLQQMQHQKKATQRHHQHLHQKKVDDFNLIEPERLSIYRSDSGISNSSYECVTPVPAPRVGTVLPGGTTTTNILVAGKIPTNRGAKSQTTPVYMNVVDGAGNTIIGGGSSTTSSPSTLVHTSPYESPSSQNDPSADPTSVSSSQSLYSSTNRCTKHPQAMSGLVGSGSSQQEVTTPEEASTSTTATANTSSSGKCKRRTGSSCSASLQSLERAPNTTTNPFLATNHSTSSSSGCASSTGSTSASNHSQSSRIHRTPSSASTQYSQPSIKSSPQHHGSGGSKQQVLMSNNNSHHHHQEQQQQQSSSSGSATDGDVSSEDPAVSISTHPLTSETSEISEMGSIRNCNGNILGGALNNSSNHHHPQQHQQTTKKHHHPGYTTRPVRLPLRKHHSFHFQPSQTVAGIRSKHRLKQQQQHAGGAAIANGISGGKCPVGLRQPPFLNENSAFKPISPVDHITSGGVSSRLVCNELIQGNFAEIKANPTTDGSAVPRICGTSLKRHMSNVETYDGSRYNKQFQFHHHHHQRRVKHHSSEDDEDDDDDDEDVESDDEEYDNDVSKQVVYADVMKPPALAQMDELAINSDSEMIRQRQQNQPYRQKDFPGGYPNCLQYSTGRENTRTSSCRSIDIDPDYTFYEDEDADVTILSVASSSPGRHATTQYAARKFNEVKI